MYVIDLEGRFIAANQAALAAYEYEREELADIALADIADAHYLDMLKEQVRLLLRGIPQGRPYEVLTRSKGGKAIWVEVKSRSILDRDHPVAIQGIARNITERKLAEEKIRFRERELEEKTRHLEEANAALKVLLRHREEDRRAMEAMITANMQKLVIPYLNVLKESPLDKSQVHHLEILDSHLQDIVSPFLHDLTAKYPQLTMQEMKVITYIREGKSSKEIADLLNVSPRTVDGHRDHIRRKLGIDNRNINLRSFLNSL